jgi:hypothetical protein
VTITIRKNSTTSRGAPFDAVTIQAVGNKAQTAPGVDPRVRRKDPCGAWMNRADYGLTTHLGCGWEVDHIKPASKGGTDDISNLQALQWENNRSKSDNEFGWTCAVVSHAR